MDFELSSEQELFQRTIRDFVDTHIRPVAREWEHADRYPTEIVSVMKDMGLFGMTIPEAYGGQELDMVSLAIVFEEISKAWMGVAGIIGSHSLACLMIARHGTDAQKARFLPDLATGVRRTGIALTEAGGGSDLQGITTRAWREGDNYVVRGTKMWITNARHADPLPVLVKTDPAAEPRHRGMSILLVEQGLDGVSVTRDLGKLGYKGPETCEVVLDDVRVPVDCLLGGVEGRGMQQALSALECGRINIAARAVGVASASIDAALGYTKQRHAFGQPLAEFQAVQLKLADMATSVQAARLLTYWAASKLDTGGRADVETGMAKLFASEIAITCALDAMRLHGAYGYSTELDIERYYRDAPLMAIGEGTNDILRTVIARGLLSRHAT
ncbi:MAG TPA: acyl-CoA dehydrogenase family protein [Acidimicrobiales bacterium]|nr:acyl-CoA dehydrogenase family protein [Acidimicrobiales bacterium]